MWNGILIILRTFKNGTRLDIKNVFGCFTIDSMLFVSAGLDVISVATLFSERISLASR
jgi:hypothetical protein